MSNYKNHYESEEKSSNLKLRCDSLIKKSNVDDETKELLKAIVLEISKSIR